VPRLLGLRFESIGHPDARLGGVTLRFTGADGQPCDSVIWLRNGGGKSSILNLVFSLLRPSQREFLGAEAEAKVRELRDYVLPDDVSTVCLAWQLDHTPALLLTGVSMEAGRPGELPRLFYAIRVSDPGAADALDLDRLPLHVLDEATGKRHLRRLPALREALTRLDDPPRVKVDVVDVQRKWGELLTSYGIDPEVFGYQLKMNRREGAADEIFRFASAIEFADFLLDMVLSTEDADQVSENLRGFRVMLQRRPALLEEGEALKRGAAELAALLSLAEQRDEALGRRRQGAQALAALCRRLDRTISKQSAALAAALAAQKAQEALRGQAQVARRRHVMEGIVLRACLTEAQAAARGARAEQAQRDLDQARRNLQRLTLAALLARLFQTRARQRTLYEALAERLKESAPLLRALQRAAAALCQALDGELAALAARQDLLGGQLRLLAEREEALRARRQDDREEIAAAAVEARGLRESMRRVEERWQVLREEGICQPDEALAAAQERHEAHLRELAVMEAAAPAARDSAQEAYDAARHAAAQAQAQAQVRAREAEAEGRRLREAEAELAALRDAPLLQEILEDPAADLLQMGAAVLQRIAAHAAQAGQGALDERVAGALHARALEALEQRELLPPSLSTDRVQRHLREAGISAFSGGAYLAHNATPERAAALIQARPDLCAGLVVDEEDLPRAEAALRDLRGLAPEEPVAVGTTGALLLGGPPRVVVLPASALYDRGAAVHERERRRQEEGERRERLDRLAARKEALDRLHLRLSRALEQHGPAWFEAARQRIARLVDEAAAQRAAAAQEEERAKAAREALQRLRQATEERARARAGAERARARISALREQGGDELLAWRRRVDEVVAAQARAEQDLAEVDQLLAALSAQRGPLEGEGRRLALEQALLGREREAAQADQGAGAGPEEGRDEAPIPAQLDEARQAYQTRRRLYDERTGGEALRGEIEATGRQAAAMALELDTALSQAGIPQAEVSAALEDAESALGLPATEQRARQAELRARDALIEARAALEHAREQARQAAEGVAALRREGRARASAIEECMARCAGLDAAALEQAAEEAAAAARLAQQAEEEAQRCHAEATAQRAAAEEVLTRARALGRRLEDARDLLAEEPALQAIFAVPPETEGDDEAETMSDAALMEAQGDEVVAQVQRSQRQVRALDQQAEEAARALASFAAHPAQASLPMALRDRLSEPRLQVLLDRVPDLLREVELRGETLAAELGQIEQHRHLLCGELLRVSEPALHLLRSLERASLFPPWVAGWGGEPFIRVQVREPESAAQREAVAAGLLDQLVQQADVPSGLRLIQRMVRELTRGEGLGVQVVKPEVIRRRPHYESIEKLRSFSRGEQLTAAILLYCTLARLRAQKRGGRKSATQVLILDNPIGTCSKAELVTLQRDMAAAHGVQLIYTTGVEDLEALARLPNTIRLHNAHVDTRGRLHVTLADSAGPAGADAAGSEGLQVARIARREARRAGAGDKDRGAA
jgi:hypothetical protein